MKKEFSCKDASGIIKNIKKTIDELSFSSKYLPAVRKEIKEMFFNLEKSYDFDALVENEIKGKHCTFENQQFDKLILSLKKYMVVSKQAGICQELIDTIKNETSKDIEQIKIASNPILWFFSSKKKKECAISTYERIKNYEELSSIVDAKKVINSNYDYNNILISDAISEFNVDKYPYENLIKEITVSNVKQYRLPLLNRLVEIVEKCNQKIQSVDDNLSKLEEEVKQSINEFITVETIDRLRAIPIDELNREKIGLRLKPLKEKGYLTLADTLIATQSELSSVYGISADAAYTIKAKTEEIVEHTKKEIKIKLSYDNKNKQSTNLVVKIFKYRQTDKTIDEFNRICEEYENVVDDNLSFLEEVLPGIYWLFYSDEYKGKVSESYKTVREIINKEFEPKISQCYISLKKLLKEDNNNFAWDDFKNNPIAYNNLIEKLSPGILGNDELIYGLPEELARKIQEADFFPDGLLCELRRYQEWGVKYILHQERVLLGDEMGLGKTVQAIATMVSLRNIGATHFVVLCPASVVSNWCREICKHSRLRTFKAHGRGKKAIVKEWVKVGGVVVTTYESASSFELEQDFKFSQLIVDEAHYIKNRNANRTITAIELSLHADRLLFMTGTPLENNVGEMISLIDILNPKIAAEIEGIAFMSTAQEFRNKIAPVYYRRKREDVLTELPEKIENDEWCTMTDEEAKKYDESVYERKFMEMRRVSWNVDDLKKSSKMQRLLEIIESAAAEGRKILIFSFFLDTIDKICKYLGYKKCLNPITGKISAQRRQQIIDEFDKAPEGTVLCAQITSGGTGLNIQSASVVVICEPQLKPSIENQAISRAYRMGQSRNVQVFRLLCEESVDESIKEILEEKQEQFDAFADKSEAAENIEINDQGYNDIIAKEIERINKKKGKIDIDINFADKENVVKRDPCSVTKRADCVIQPPGSYLNPQNMTTIMRENLEQLNEVENIAPNIMGLVVDYLTRFMIEDDVEKAFSISLKGAYNAGEIDKALKLAYNIIDLDDESIISAVRLCEYDCAYRVGVEIYKSAKKRKPDNVTIENIRIMVERSLEFFEEYGPLIKSGITFEGGYSEVIVAGDADFITKDTLWDFKVSKREPTNKHTLQLLIYYLMGLRSDYETFKNIEYIGIYNPRLNKVYRYPISMLSQETKELIEKEVICYKN